MAGINQLFGDDLQNIFKKYEDIAETSPDGLGLPPGVLDRLGMHPRNKQGGRKVMNNDGAGDFSKSSTPKMAQRNSQGKRNRKCMALLKEKARALASRAKYYEASSLLEEVEENEEIKDLGTKLLMAECYLQLGRENKASQSLNHVKKSLTSEPLMSSENLINLAKEFVGQSSFVRAIIILDIAVDVILQGSANPDEKLSGVYLCYTTLDEAVKAMLKHGGRNRNIAADMGMENMLSMYEKIRGIRGCDRDKQVLREAKCCRRLDYNFYKLNEHKKSIQIGTRAIKSMEDHFTPSGAQQYQVYGWLLHNLGVTLCNVQKFDEALAVQQKALKAKEQATDYENESVKRQDIDTTKEGMRVIRSKMGKLL